MIALPIASIHIGQGRLSEEVALEERTLNNTQLSQFLQSVSSQSCACLWDGVQLYNALRLGIVSQLATKGEFRYKFHSR
jgi:hypothetical protein